MKHWFVFFLALASVGSVKGQQTITLSNGNMVAGAYKQPPTRTVKSVDDGYIITYTFDKATVIDDPLYKGSIMWKVAGFGGSADFPGWYDGKSTYPYHAY